MIHRPRATVSILLTRVVAGLTVMGTYVALRLPDLASPWEVVAVWVGATAIGAVTIRAIERLAVQHRASESTDQFEVQAGWPDHVENAIAEARHAAMTPLIARGEVVEPALFTHEFNPLTPPHGVDKRELFRQLYTPPSSENSERIPAAELIARLRAERPSPTGRTIARHVPQLTRERSGQLFGDLS